ASNLRRWEVKLEFDEEKVAETLAAHIQLGYTTLIGANTLPVLRLPLKLHTFRKTGTRSWQLFPNILPEYLIDLLKRGTHLA
ncbi:hypothetical protein MPER_02958, partial [Moniliophthora perniciosa FA553]